MRQDHEDAAGPRAACADEARSEALQGGGHASRRGDRLRCRADTEADVAATARLHRVSPALSRDWDCDPAHWRSCGLSLHRQVSAAGGRERPLAEHPGSHPHLGSENAAHDVVESITHRQPHPHPTHYLPQHGGWPRIPGQPSHHRQRAGEAGLRAVGGQVSCGRKGHATCRSHPPAACRRRRRSWSGGHRSHRSCSPADRF